MHSNRGAIIAIIVGGAITVLLSVKDPVHEFADRIEKANGGRRRSSSLNDSGWNRKRYVDNRP
jgi:hypothetical protein